MYKCLSPNCVNSKQKNALTEFPDIIGELVPLRPFAYKGQILLGHPVTEGLSGMASDTELSTWVSASDRLIGHNIAAPPLAQF